ncbi:hypothetical protein JN27_07090 [Massilia sp. BSC265]|nr:hypothetical protein JN27_07090 [Massilia sp. BSC265]
MSSSVLSTGAPWRTARPPSETMPASAMLSRSTTGILRNCWSPICCSTSPMDWSAKHHDTSLLITSAIVASSGAMPRATARAAMSRSVTMPIRRRPSHTGNAPTSMSRISCAASCSLASGPTVRTFMISEMACVTFSLKH